MPEDFFADGFGQEQGVIFTKEEDQFLQKKKVFLDPMKTYQISIAKVLALLKYTKLDHQSIMKILQNSTSTGIGQKILTYDEMKKIFRGVALKQNKMQPSKINIEANIKTKMPIFYDDDDESDQQQSQPQPKPKQSEPQKTPPLPINQSHPTNQPPQPVKVQVQTDPLKAYDDYWKNLKTKNNLIDGTEVKKMFSNNTLSKNNLSKAWKLCNISEKGYLTKGEFFIFMNLINSNNIPEALTKEMKQFISKIEQACGYKKSGSQQSGQRASTSSIAGEKGKEKRVSDTFDKFADESLFAKNASKVQEATKGNVMKNSSTIFPAPQSNVGSSSIAPMSNQSSNNMSKSALLLLEKIGKQEKVQQKQISTINANNQQLITGLGSIEQYLSVVQKNLQSTSIQIQALKQNQNSLNQRLNNVCLNFKNIITKQSECIKFLMDTINVESQSSIGRLQVLEGYTEQMVSIVDANMQFSKNAITNIQNQQNAYFHQVKISNQNLKQKISLQKQKTPITQSPIIKDQSHNRKPHSVPNSPQTEYYRPSDPFEDHENQEEHRIQQGPTGQSDISKQFNNAPSHQQHPIRNMGSEQNNQTQEETPLQQSHVDLQNLSPEDRKKTKQMLLINILNSVSSMNEEVYAQVVSKVVAMTDQQMNQSYTKLHALYLQNMTKAGTTTKYPVPSPQYFSSPQFMDEKYSQKNQKQ